MGWGGGLELAVFVSPGRSSQDFDVAEDQACNRRKILVTFSRSFKLSPARRGRCAREAKAQVRDEPDTRRAVGG